MSAEQKNKKMNFKISHNVNNKSSNDMEQKIFELLRQNKIGHAKAHYLKHELLLLFSVSNSALIEACKTVVDGYEGDGMENMQNRDEVFYRECKSALGHCY